jgi:hypothetical protein
MAKPLSRFDDDHQSRPEPVAAPTWHRAQGIVCRARCRRRGRRGIPGGGWHAGRHGAGEPIARPSAACLGHPRLGSQWCCLCLCTLCCLLPLMHPLLPAASAPAAAYCLCTLCCLLPLYPLLPTASDALSAACCLCTLFCLLPLHPLLPTASDTPATALASAPSDTPAAAFTSTSSATPYAALAFAPSASNSLCCLLPLMHPLLPWHLHPFPYSSTMCARQHCAVPIFWGVAHIVQFFSL